MTYVFEATKVTVNGVRIVVIRVPDVVLDSPMKSGIVMTRAEHEFGCPPLLLGEDKGRIAGNQDRRRLLIDHSFDPDKAIWAQWNMVEPD